MTMLESATWRVRPGLRNTISVPVTNAREVVDGIRATIDDLDDSMVEIPIPVVSVFPGSTEQVKIHLDLPRTFPCGEATVQVRLTSTVDGAHLKSERVVLSVEALADVNMALSPRAAKAGARTAIRVDIENRGNTEAHIHLRAVDTERALRIRTEPSALRLRGGENDFAIVDLRGPRPFFGRSAVRLVEVTAETGSDVSSETFTFTQKPRIPAGVGTVAILTAIVALWALVFMWGIREVLAEDATAKTLRTDLISRLPELDLAAITSTLTGTIENAEGDGIPRLTVSAIRTNPDGTETVVSSVATDEAGNYILPVVPGTYLLRVEGDGFPAMTLEETVEAKPGETSASKEPFEAMGRPGTLRGQILVETTESAEAPTYSIDIETWVDDAPGELLDIEATITPTGGYTITDLFTPATYRLTLQAEGYESQTLIADLDAGGDVILNTRKLSAGVGSIRGRVTAGGVPLGGVTVDLYAADEVLTTTTPTAGADIGVYQFTDLPSPDTYLITFTAEGFSQEAIALELEPGAAVTDADQDMQSGTGSLAGKVSGPDGPLGGVTISVVGADTDQVVQSLTAGEIGAWALQGLPTPGDYAVTFSLEGFTAETVAVSLGDRESATRIDATMTSSTGQIGGTVTVGGVARAGIEVELTDGQNIRTTTSVTEPAGNYLFPQVQPGSYTLRFFEAETERSHFVLVEVSEGLSAVADASFATFVSPSSTGTQP